MGGLSAVQAIAGGLGPCVALSFFLRPAFTLSRVSRALFNILYSFSLDEHFQSSLGALSFSPRFVWWVCLSLTSVALLVALTIPDPRPLRAMAAQEGGGGGDSLQSSLLSDGGKAGGGGLFDSEGGANSLWEEEDPVPQPKLSPLGRFYEWVASL